MLTNDEISDIAMQSGAYDEQLSAFARAIEAAVLAKLKQQEPVAWRDKHNKFDLYTKHFNQLDAEPLYLHPAPVQHDMHLKNLQDSHNALAEAHSNVLKENALLEAQNKALAGAAKLTIAWYEAEDDHSKADFYKRLEMCRASESALRAAIAQVEGRND